MNDKSGKEYFGIKDECCKKNGNIEDLPSNHGYAQCKVCKRVFIYDKLLWRKT